jgi:hypothetical protein
MDRAFFAAVRLHRMHGIPMALWEDGRVKYVDPHEILLLPEDDRSRADAREPADSEAARRSQPAR